MKKISIHPDDRPGVDTHRPENRRKQNPPPPPPRSPEKKRRFSLWMLKLSFIFFIWFSFFGGCVVLWYSYDLPDITKLQTTERRPSLTILAKNGTKLATYGDLHRQMVDIKKLPPHLIQALL